MCGGVTVFAVSIIYQIIAYLCLSLTGDFDIVMVSRLPLLESSSISMDYIQGANVHFVVCSKICIVDDILWYIRPRGV